MNDEQDDGLKYISSRAFKYFVCDPPRGICEELDKIVSSFEEDRPGVTSQVAAANMATRLVPHGQHYMAPRFINDVHIEFKFDKKIPELSNVKNLDVSKAKISSPPSNYPHFILKLKLTDTIYSAVIVPLGYLLKLSESDLTAGDSNQLYEHLFLCKKDGVKGRNADRNAALRALKGLPPLANRPGYTDHAYRYVGLTSRTWQVRYDEHLRSARSGSNTLFHKALRKEGFSSDYGGMQEHVVVRAGLTDDEVNRMEEDFVAKTSWVVNNKYGLNMIPGGTAGFKYLKSMDYPWRDLNSNIRRRNTLEHIETDLAKYSSSAITALIKRDKATFSKAVSSWANSKICIGDKPSEWVENIEEVQRYVDEATFYNYERKCGRLPPLPKRPSIKIKEGLTAENYSSHELLIKKTINSLNLSSEFTEQGLKLVYREGSFLSGETRLEVHHKACGTISLAAFNSIKAKRVNDSRLKVTCSKRDCFEAMTGIKLGTNAATPSRAGTIPVNVKAVAVIAQEVNEASEGLLELLPDTYKDVRANYWVRINCPGSLWDQHYLCVGGHDNALRKEVLQKHAARIKGNKPFNYKTKIQTEYPNSTKNC